MSRSESSTCNLIFQPNYTQIPNVIFDYWMGVLSHAEFKILCAICRKTFGWKKTQDHISTKQIMKLTGVSKRCVQQSVNILIEHGLVEVIHSKTTDGDDAPNLFTILIQDIEEKEEDDGGVQSVAPPMQPLHGVGQPVAKGRATSSHTKETIQKKESIYIGRFVKIEKNELDKLYAEHTKSKVNEIFQLINDYCANHKTQGYKDYAAAFRTFLKNQIKDEEKRNANRSYDKNKRKPNNGQAPEERGLYLNGKRIE